MELASVPFTRQECVILDHGLLQRRHVALTSLDGRSNHGFVLSRRIVLSNHSGCRAVDRAGTTARGRVAAMTGLRSTVRIPRRSKTGEDGRRNLTVLFLLRQHFVGYDLHRIVGPAHVLDRFDLGYPEIYGGLAQIVDAYNKHRTTIGLKLP